MNPKELLIKEISSIKNISVKDLSDTKRRISKNLKISCPSNIELLKVYHSLVEKKSIEKNTSLELILRTRPIRSLAGVVNVSVLTKPYECPGKCLYCPSEKNIPKSYLSGEPAVERAKRLKFNPYEQTIKRIEVLEMSGHPTDKVEIRMIGGTWSFYDRKYKIWFVKKCFDACNETPNRKNDKNLTIDELWLELKKAQKKNENAKHRIVGMSFETRPDFITLAEAEEMKKLGATKIEIGAQSIDDKILAFNKRGHNIKQTIIATKILKDMGFKVAYQMMLNLPLSNPKKDIFAFEELFKNKDFQPDYLKIYPCALVKEAPLYEFYKKGKYKPYDKKTLVETIKSIKKILPRYTRVERIIRDIPAPSIIEGGAKISNLRQVIEEEMKKEKWQCNCIRCREAKNIENKEKIKIFRKDYDASDGKEIFLSFEDNKNKHLFSLLRLRIPSQFFGNKNMDNILPVLRDCAIIRELHTYGQAIALMDNKTHPYAQHKGLGLQLIKEAERITKEEFHIKKMAIISGVGVRSYYRNKLGYKLRDGYMIKIL
ncbi:MAG: tRNA uridine(34) 5-carboxymethylaminomethyl modification radical SAM/GNAT enzyme Elp3 [Candidatus Pacebacteria bacterium]|nr:tRNA uridine(34) 5-carboxymethylaminomethyl modification radical SAM/GNAT enzyme Elp3 [Candidatus Paceibacterota bacterium]